MPRHKNGTLYYTQEQYDYARTQISALDYAQQRGYELKHSGRWYSMKEHDSMVFTPDGKWFWNSHQLKGGALEFMMKYEGYTLVNAVLTLNNDPALEQSVPIHPGKSSEKVNMEKKPFELPIRADNFKRLFAYLCGVRKLDPGIVQGLVEQKLLYESVTPYTGKDGKEVQLHNAAFITYDNDGQAVGGVAHGLTTYGDRTYRGDIPGSDKQNHAWTMEGTGGCKRLVIFEAPIDAVSHATCEKMKGLDWRQETRLATGGVTNHKPVLNYLKAHPEIREIVIDFDHDEAGKTGTQALRNTLVQNGFSKANGFTLYRQVPLMGKDFNEYLQIISNQMQQQEELDFEPD